MKHLIVLVLIVLGLNTTLFSQNYMTLLIPDSLKKSANSIIRLHDNELTILSKTQANIRIHKVITVLNQAGKKNSSLVIFYDKFSKVTHVQGKIYDATGKEIEKIKSKDILDVSYYDGFSLYADNRVKYYEATTNVFPYTVEYEYELHLISYLGLPSFYPIDSYNTSVEFSKFTLVYPQKMVLNIDESKFKGDKTKLLSGFENRITYSVKNLKALEFEAFEPDENIDIQRVRIIPNEFEMEGYAGKAESWQTYGEWVSALNKNRQNLPPETVADVIKLTEGISDSKEKARLIYEYMQKKTRYVNIAVGIGGWQPFPAETVDKNGYGDCKALSNYTASLLACVGIESNYALIKAGEHEPDIDPKTPSTQFNHAVLCIPFDTDTVWLECTSQTMPFGYFGTFTDNRNALIISNKGSKIVRTPKFETDQNLYDFSATCKLDNEGNISINSEGKYHGLRYEDAMQMLKKTDIERKKHIMEQLDRPALTLNSFTYAEHRESKPYIVEKLDYNIKNFASLSAKRLFVQPFKVVERTEIPPDYPSRTKPIEVRRGRAEHHVFYYKMPKDFRLNAVPQSIQIETEFGYYRTSFDEKDDNGLVIKRVFVLKEGLYPKEKYPEFRDFFKQVAKSDAQTMVLTKIE